MLSSEEIPYEKGSKIISRQGDIAREFFDCRFRTMVNFII